MHRHKWKLAGASPDYYFFLCTGCNENRFCLRKVFWNYEKAPKRFIDYIRFRYTK